MKWKMNKKWVFVIVMLLVVAAILSRYFWLKRKSPELHISEENVSVEGLKKEYRLFFVSDSHISLADERDTDEVREKAKQRHESVLYEGYASEQYFDALVKEAGKRNWNSIRTSSFRPGRASRFRFLAVSLTMERSTFPTGLWQS